jgi:hypothetical protein
VTKTEVGTSFYDNHSVDFPVPGSSHDDGDKKEVHDVESVVYFVLIYSNVPLALLGSWVYV